MKSYTKLWIGIGILALLSPLGIIVPSFFKAGKAWGEWAPDSVKVLIGYVPAGLEKFSSLWKAPVPDYVFKGWAEKGVSQASLAYILSAILGVGLTVLVVFLIGAFLARKNKNADRQ